MESEHIIIDLNVNVMTPPFEEGLLSHIAQTAETSAPSLIPQPDVQLVVPLLANRLSLCGENMSNQSHFVAVVMLHHILKALARASLGHILGVPLF